MKKIIGIITLGIFSLASILALPAVSSAAAVQASAKEEVIYAIMDADGQPTGAYVVNIFDGGDGDIVDYGKYSAVKMLNTTDQIKQDGDKITFSPTADRVYYQGDLTDTPMPWNIDVSYWLDGKAYSAAEIAGQSGALKIKIAISKNEKCSGSYFDDYTLQATMLLDTKHCSNIKAAGATVADVGSDKQLSWIVLPGTATELTVSANVNNFSMEALSINGIKLNLDIDASQFSNSGLMSKVDDVMSAAVDLDDGANQLYDGAAALNSGTKTLNKGVVTIQDGLTELNGNSGTLVAGSAEVKEALTTIDNALSQVAVNTEQIGQLAAASDAIQAGIDQLTGGIGELEQQTSSAAFKKVLNDNGLDLDALQAGNKTALATLGALQSELGGMQDQLAGFKELAEKFGYGDLYDNFSGKLGSLVDNVSLLQTLLTGDIAAIDGAQEYLDALNGGVDQLYDGAVTLQQNYRQFNAAIGELATLLTGLGDSMSQLAGGISQLTAQYDQLDSGIGEYTAGVSKILTGYSQLVSGSAALVSGSSSLVDGAAAMTDGTGTFRTETSGMDSKINTEITAALDSLTAQDKAVQSFVSDKNTNVEAVQFVMKTAAVAEPEAAAEDTAPVQEELTFWQKLLNLFK